MEIVSAQTAFEGRSFGSVGTYRKLRGKAYGEINPNDPRNAFIADLALAPRNARGRGEYSMDIYLLKPTDPAKVTTSCSCKSTTVARSCLVR